MNWFQIVFLREDSQAGNNSLQRHVVNWFQIVFLREDSQDNRILGLQCVVNWFQIVFLREDSQELELNMPRLCCELISNCIFTWGFTSNSDIANDTLWIDFKLYFYVRIHKKTIAWTPRRVVNWFQIVFLREDSQDSSKTIANLLWIDFKLYFYVRIHKSRVCKSTLSVVNWFQIVFLREDSQASMIWLIAFSCELISNCIFTWGFTSGELQYSCLMLWIDFKLYFYVRIHKCRFR